MSESKLPGLCESLGIKLTAEHVRLVLPKPVNTPTWEKKPEGWAHDEWSVTIKYTRDPLTGEEREFDTSSFKTGLGLRKVPSWVKKERGGYYDGGHHHRLFSLEEACKENILPVKKPTCADVLYSLLMSASGSEQSFKHWCGDFGYSDDSIKALETYRECQNIRDSLIRMFGHEVFEQLVEACQDY